MIYPKFEKPFLLYTDASSFGLGTVLAQKDNNDKEHVVAYASKRTSTQERNYCATELECLDVIWAVQHFRSYLQSNILFTVITDVTTQIFYNIVILMIINHFYYI